jgi:hypothetical protein
MGQKVRGTTQNLCGNIQKEHQHGWEVAQAAPLLKWQKTQTGNLQQAAPVSSWWAKKWQPQDRQKTRSGSQEVKI